MKILLEITILVTLNLFLFGYIQRKMAILVVASPKLVRQLNQHVAMMADCGYSVRQHVKLVYTYPNNSHNIPLFPLWSKNPPPIVDLEEFRKARQKIKACKNKALQA